MLIMSMIAAFFGPISEIWYFADYWEPGFVIKLPVGGVEDMLFGFSIGGIGAFIYESLFVNSLCFCAAKRYRREWFLLVFAGIIGVSMLFFNNILGINSIFASSIGMIAAALVMLWKRPDLITNAFGSALLVVTVMFMIYFFGQELFPTAHQWMIRVWKLYGTSQGVIIAKHVPLTEIIWAFSWGLVWGPMYEFLVGARIMKLR